MSDSLSLNHPQSRQRFVETVMSSATLPAPPLSQGTGYGVIIGLGAFFAIVVIGISQALHRFSGITQSASEYAVASRSLGVGLTAAGAVSAWCWSVTLLSSVSTAYNYGISGALIYGACNMSQVALFSLMAIQLKRKAPSLHTHLEMQHIRFGAPGHLTFLFFALATNILVVSAVLTGAAATVNAITGVNVYASLFLLPLAVCAYTLRGGLRATILADYLHTVVIFIILFVLFFKTYATSPIIGSPGKMYDLLTRAAVENPSENYAGSWVTGKSLGAIKFGWLSFMEYLGVVFNDASFHQKGVAATPEATVPGYILGSLSWFSIPWVLATTTGLIAIALEQTSPSFPTYPNKMTKDEVSAGLVLPYAAQAILGKGGSAAVLLLMFLSSTSAISAQLIAVSSIAGYDLYKTYINRTATPHQILRCQEFAVVGFSLFMAAFGCLLHGVGVDLNFLYQITGVWSTAALPQMIFSFFSARLPRWSVFPGIWIGFSAGLAVWLSLAKRLVGQVDLAALEDTDVCLYTYTTTIAVGLIVSTIGVVFTPSDFQWESIWESSHVAAADEQEVALIKQDTRFSAGNLKKWLIIAGIGAGTIFTVFMLIWPLSLYRDYIFTKSFFEGWIGVSGAWAFLAFGLVGLYPLWEGRFIFLKLVQATWSLLTTGKFELPNAQETNIQHEKEISPGGAETAHDNATPNSSDSSINEKKQQQQAEHKAGQLPTVQSTDIEQSGSSVSGTP